MCRRLAQEGFVLLEAMATCALVMLTWFFITQCAVQALVLEKQSEKKAAALIVATTALEKIRAGVYPLQNRTSMQDGMQIIISCEQKIYAELLYIVAVKVLVDAQELVCIKTAVLKA